VVEGKKMEEKMEGKKWRN
jgi:predicted RNase H-like nuclease (RuvC/YqgF family)